MRSKVPCVAAACFMLALPATHAVELHPFEVRRGTDGLERVVVSVTDAAGAPITCQAELAHWYSAAPTRIAPGAAAAIELWRDPASGTYSLLNDSRENMTAEALWCGFERTAYETRALIPLDRSPGAPTSRAVTCEAAPDGRLRCR